MKKKKTTRDALIEWGVPESLYDILDVEDQGILLKYLQEKFGFISDMDWYAVDNLGNLILELKDGKKFSRR